MNPGRTSFVAKSAEKLNRYFVVEFDSDLCRPFMDPFCDGRIDGAFFGQSLQDGSQISLGFARGGHTIIVGYRPGESTGMFPKRCARCYAGLCARRGQEIAQGSQGEAIAQ